MSAIHSGHYSTLPDPGRAATPDAYVASLIETCKMNAIDPHVWLTSTLTSIVNGHKQSQIDYLLPWNYAEKV